jgi:D-glycero-D-manno-heptose 1,7-bisphosphate phosphatase
LKRAAVFLDRDGTLIEDPGYVDRLDLIRPYPWTADAIRLLNRAGFMTVVITNQSGIGRGRFDEVFVGKVHETLDRILAAGRAHIDAYYFCPHHPEAEVERYRQVCHCRKPGAGMIEQACRELEIDPYRSVMVGDKWIDIQCGQAAGTRSLLVKTGYGTRLADRVPAGTHADAILNNLMEAAGWILRTCSR